MFYFPDDEALIEASVTALSRNAVAARGKAGHAIMKLVRTSVGMPCMLLYRDGLRKNPAQTNLL